MCNFWTFFDTCVQWGRSEEKNLLGVNKALLRFWSACFWRALVQNQEWVILIVSLDRHVFSLHVSILCLSPMCFSRRDAALPRVRWVLPDSYLDVKNKDYGGEVKSLIKFFVFWCLFYRGICRNTMWLAICEDVNAIYYPVLYDPWHLFLDIGIFISIFQGFWFINFPARIYCYEWVHESSFTWHH